MTYHFLGSLFSLAVVTWVFTYRWCFVLKGILHGLLECLWSGCWDSLAFIYWLPACLPGLGSLLADFGHARCWFFNPPHVLLLHWRRCVPGVIFESFFLTLFCGKFKRLVMLSCLNHSLFSIDVIIYRVVLDLRLATSAFSFKFAQLRGVLGS